MSGRSDEAECLPVERGVDESVFGEDVAASLVVVEDETGHDPCLTDFLPNLLEEGVA